jgi:hypothetical protein
MWSGGGGRIRSQVYEDGIAYDASASSETQDGGQLFAAGTGEKELRWGFALVLRSRARTVRCPEIAPQSRADKPKMARTSSQQIKQAKQRSSTTELSSIPLI